MPELILWAVVLLIGVPSAWRNPTAGALVLAYIASKTIYIVTGNALAVEYYAYPDIFVLAVIFAKREYCNLRPYRSTWHQLVCVVMERSPADRFIMLSFPVCWWIYASGLHPFYQWWGLFAISVAQFLAAGVEALTDHLRRRGADAASKPDHGAMLVAYPGGGYG